MSRRTATRLGALLTGLVMCALLWEGTATPPSREPWAWPGPRTRSVERPRPARLRGRSAARVSRPARVTAANRMPPAVVDRNSIRGVAEFPDGTPADGIDIEFRWLALDEAHAEDAGLTTGASRTDERGRFHLTGLREGWYSIQLPMIAQSVSCRTGTHDVRWVISRPRIRAWIRDERGCPVAEARVHATRTYVPPTPSSPPGSYPPGLGFRETPDPHSPRARPASQVRWSARCVTAADGSANVWVKPGEQVRIGPGLPGRVFAKNVVHIDRGVWSRDIVLTWPPRR